MTTTTQYLNTKSLVEFARSRDASFAQTFYDKLTTIQALRDSYFIIASVNVIVRFPAKMFQLNHSSCSIQVIAFRMLQFLERQQQLSLLTRTLRASFKASMWFLIVFFVIFIGVFLPPNNIPNTPRFDHNLQLSHDDSTTAFSLTGFFLWRYSLWSCRVPVSYPVTFSSAPPSSTSQLWAKASRRVSE